MHTDKNILLLCNDNNNNSKIMNLFKNDYSVIRTTDLKDFVNVFNRDSKLDLIIVDISENTQLQEEIKKKKYQIYLNLIPVVYILNENEIENNQSILKGNSDFVLTPLNLFILKLRCLNIIEKNEIQKEKAIKERELASKQNNSYEIIHHVFSKKASKILSENKENEYIIIRFSIDDFKIFNDLYGKEACDHVTICIEESLGIYITPNIGIFTKLYNDNFAILMLKNNFDYDKLNSFIISNLESKNIDYKIKLNFGIYEIVDNTIPFEKMCDRAELALQSIKGSYTKKYAVYDDNIRQSMLQEQIIASEIKFALNKKQFVFYLQPIYNLKLQKIISAEVLVRWMHPIKGLILPSEFIPIFEKYGYISKLDLYVWEETCKFISERKSKGKQNLVFSVNLSKLSFDNTLADNLINIAEKYSIDPQYLQIEVTETAYEGDATQMHDIINYLQKYGFKILMDNFGSGLQSVKKLKNLTMDVLKLDMRFINDLDDSNNLLPTIVRMAKWLKLPVISEDVETKSQLEYLKSIGCDTVQGHYFSRPLTVDDFENKILETMDYECNTDALIEDDSDLSFENLFSDNFASKLVNSVLGSLGFFEFTDNKLEIIRGNQSFYDIFGVYSNDFYENPFNIANYLYKNDYEKLIDTCENVVKNKKTASLIVRTLSDKNKDNYISINIGYLNNHSLNAVLCLSISNITENITSKNSNKILKQNFLELLTDTSLFGFMQLNEDGKLILYANDFIKEWYGWTGKDKNDISNNILNAVVLEDRLIFAKAIQFCSETGLRSDFKLRIIRENSEYAWVTGSLEKISTEKDEQRLQVALFNVSEEELKLQNINSHKGEITSEIMSNSTVAEAIYYVKVNDELEVNIIKPLYLNNHYCSLICDESHNSDVYNSHPLILTYPQFKKLKEDNLESVFTIERNDNEKIIVETKGYIKLESNNEYICYFVTKDITSKLKENKKIIEKRDKHKLLIYDTQYIVFDYAPDTQTMIYSMLLEDNTRKEITINKYLEYMKSELSKVHPQFRNKFLEKLMEASLKPVKGSFEFKANINTNSYRWYRAKYQSFVNKSGKIFRLIGKLHDINDTMETTLALKAKAEIDAMSGLFNRATSEELLNEALISNKDKKYAFFLIDIDHFKTFNDTFGHLFGDKIIKEIAKLLKNQFNGKNDIVGRLGGDEFGSLFQYEDISEITYKADNVLHKINDLSNKLEIDKGISVSIGISLSPDNGIDFTSVFEKADIGLYCAKHKGRNQYCIYQ